MSEEGDCRTPGLLRNVTKTLVQYPLGVMAGMEWTSLVNKVMTADSYSYIR